MDRILGANTIDLGGGRRGFRGKDTVAGIPGTELAATWHNAIQEEVIGLIELSGGDPSNADLTQVAQAVRSQRLNFRVAGGTANALTITLDPAPADYAEIFEVPLRVKIATTNTGPATLNVDGLGAVAILMPSGAPLGGGELPAGLAATLSYDGTAFRLSALLVITAKERNWFGQCYLTFDSGNLLLRPDTGPGLLIDGVFRDLPSAGVTLSAAGNANATTYFIYAYWTGSAIALEKSTTGPVQDPATLQMRKTGDATRSYVGLARSGAAGAWQASPLVASHYNPKPRIMSAQMNSGNSYGGTGYVADGASKIEFVTDDGFAQCLGQGSVAVGTPIGIGGASPHIAMGIDAASPWGQAPRVHGGNMMGVAFFGVSSSLSRGYHFSQIVFHAVTGNALYYDNLENVTLTNG